jgi:hypothetical protein
MLRPAPHKTSDWAPLLGNHHLVGVEHHRQLFAAWFGEAGRSAATSMVDAPLILRPRNNQTKLSEDKVAIAVPVGKSSFSEGGVNEDHPCCG